MELSDYLRILRQRGWLIILLAMLTAGSAYGFSTMQTEVYQASSRLLLKYRPDFGQTQVAKELLRDYAQWLKSSYRAASVIDQLQLDMTPFELLGAVEVEPSTDSNIIQIRVKNSDGNLANDIARAWGDQLIQWRNQENAGLRREDRIDAEFLDDPQFGLDSPQTSVNTLAGAVFGMLLGVVLIFLLEWLQSGKIQRTEDVERYLDVPVIGKIPS